MRSSERALGVCVCVGGCVLFRSWEGFSASGCARSILFIYLFSFCSEKKDLRVRKRGQVRVRKYTAPSVCLLST